MVILKWGFVLLTVGVTGVALRGLVGIGAHVECERVRARAGRARRGLRAARHRRHAVARRRGRAPARHSCALGYVPPLRFIVSTKHTFDKKN